jgi:hypothetical protein
VGFRKKMRKVNIPRIQDAPQFFNEEKCVNSASYILPNTVYVYTPRIIFGPKRDEIIGDWRKIYNEELHNLYSSPSIIRMIRLIRMR